jgi:hypothetical protein
MSGVIVRVLDGLPPALPRVSPNFVGRASMGGEEVIDQRRACAIFMAR